MVLLLLAAQLLLAPQQPADTAAALRDVIERAVERNRIVPPSLHAYRARVESEIAMLTRRADDEESAVTLEQAQNEVRWQRSGAYEQHITGYRARQAGPSLSALAVLRTAWTIPMLYGNRLSLFFGSSSSLSGTSEDTGETAAGGRAPKRATPAVHPFDSARDRVYDFSGGDTVAVIRTSTRAISIVRVLVEPKAVQETWPVVVFRGEIDLDAERGEIARMRGQFVTLGRNGPQRQRLLVLPVSVVAFVDLESVEVDGRYWLPRFQRIETHVNPGGFAEGRTVFRIVSRFRDHQVATSVVDAGSLPGDGADNPSSLPADAPPPAAQAHRLTVAPPDSLRQPRAWWQPLGEATAQTRGDDFADVGAESVAQVSAGALTFRAQRLADVVHFNRVEGWNTGAAVALRPGARAAGVTLRANAGWAWSERALRGRVEAVRTVPSEGWSAGVRLGRTLDITNDFTAPYDSGGALVAALAGVDDYDYVDRTAATLWAGFSVARRGAMRVESGIATDRGALARLTRGTVFGEIPFRPNRGVDDGSYFRTAVIGEWNPGVNAGTLASGVGAQVRLEAARGSLDWQRATVRVTTRKELGAFGWAVRLDGGALASDDPPPQQLLELGGGPMFPGYEYKEFAGDRALAAHWRTTYRLPLLRSPLRLLGCTCFTAPAPALAITMHSARLTSSGPATTASIARLGSVGDQIGGPPLASEDATPISRPSDGWRSSLELGVRFFGGAATLGMVRVLEPGARWRATFTLGQSW